MVLVCDIINIVHKGAVQNSCIASFVNHEFYERMSVVFNQELMIHLAELSKIAFTADELEQMTVQMTDIINLMDKVKEIEHQLPTYEFKAADYEDLRSDKVRESFEIQKILENAAEKKNTSFVVPKVVS